MAISPAKRATARAEMYAQQLLPIYLTVYQLAALYQCHEISIYKWLKTEPKRLPRPTRHYGRVLFDQRDVQKWFDQQRGAVVVNPTKADNANDSGQAKRGPGRPTKGEQIRLRLQVAAQ